MFRYSPMIAFGLALLIGAKPVTAQAEKACYQEAQRQCVAQVDVPVYEVYGRSVYSTDLSQAYTQAEGRYEILKAQLIGRMGDTAQTQKLLEIMRQEFANQVIAATILQELQEAYCAQLDLQPKQVEVTSCIEWLSSNNPDLGPHVDQHAVMLAKTWTFYAALHQKYGRSAVTASHPDCPIPVPIEALRAWQEEQMAQGHVIIYDDEIRQLLLSIGWNDPLFDEPSHFELISGEAAFSQPPWLQI